MRRSTLFIAAAALAAACGGRQSPAPGAPLTTAAASVRPTGPERPADAPAPRADSAREIDRRAEQLTLRGRWDEARAVLERGIAEARARDDRAGVARLLLRRGHTVTDQTRHRGGDRGAAVADLEAARRDAEALGDPQIIAGSVDALGLVRYVRWFSSQDAADLAAADDMFRRALALRAPEDAAGRADSYFHVGLVHQMRGERDAASASRQRRSTPRIRSSRRA